MQTTEKHIRRVQKIRHGFADIKGAADEVVAHNTTQDNLRIAKKLFASEVHQARMLAPPSSSIGLFDSERARANGAHIESEPQDTDYGQREYGVAILKVIVGGSRLRSHGPHANWCDLQIVVEAWSKGNHCVGRGLREAKSSFSRAESEV